MVPSTKLGGQRSAPPPHKQQPPRGTPVMWSSTVIRSQCCWVKKYASPTSNALFNVSNPTLCRRRSVQWIASLAGGSSRWGPNELVGRDPRHTAPPSPKTACKMVRNGFRASQNYLSVSARPSEAKNDWCREVVTRGTFWMGDRLRH